MNLKKTITWEDEQELEDLLFVSKYMKMSFSKFVQKACNEKVQKNLKRMKDMREVEYHVIPIQSSEEGRRSAQSAQGGGIVNFADKIVSSRAEVPQSEAQEGGAE